MRLEKNWKDLETVRKSGPYLQLLALIMGAEDTKELRQHMEGYLCFCYQFDG